MKRNAKIFIFLQVIVAWLFLSQVHIVDCGLTVSTVCRSTILTVLERLFSAQSDLLSLLVLPSDVVFETAFRYVSIAACVIALVLNLFNKERAITADMREKITVLPITVALYAVVIVLGTTYALRDPILAALSITVVLYIALYRSFICMYRVRAVLAASGQDGARRFYMSSVLMLLLFVVTLLYEYAGVLLGVGDDRILADVFPLTLMQALHVFYVLFVFWLSLNLVRRRHSILLKRCGTLMMYGTFVLGIYWFVVDISGTSDILAFIGAGLYILYSSILAYSRFVIRGG